MQCTQQEDDDNVEEEGDEENEVQLQRGPLERDIDTAVSHFFTFFFFSMFLVLIPPSSVTSVSPTDSFSFEAVVSLKT